jgi:hypothetical protein
MNDIGVGILNAEEAEKWRMATAYLEKLIFVKLEFGLHFPEIPSYVNMQSMILIMLQ